MRSIGFEPTRLTAYVPQTYESTVPPRPQYFSAPGEIRTPNIQFLKLMALPVDLPERNLQVDVEGLEPSTSCV